MSLGILGEHYDREILPKFVSLFLGIIFLGQGISAGIGGIVIQSFSWRTILAAFSILSLLSWPLPPRGLQPMALLQAS